MENKEYSLDFNGEPLSVKFLNWVERANSSVIIKHGDTVVLCTAVMGSKDTDMPYFPLTVEYREKYYAAGFIGGGRFRKREGRPSDEATLRARLVDRALRPLFDNLMRREIQIVNTVLSYDENHTPEVLALLASSAALVQSDIPWNGPLGVVRIGKINDNWIINPTSEEQEESAFNVLFAGTKEKINMIEVDAKEASEEGILAAMEYGQEIVKKQIDFQHKIREEIGKDKQDVALLELDEDIKKEIQEYGTEKIKKAIYQKDAKEGGNEIHAVEDEIIDWLKEKYEETNPEHIKRGKLYLDGLIDNLVHEAVLKDNRRVDGRKLDEIRSLSGDTSVLPRTHGSGLFMRGLTHALSIATLDSPGEEELSDAMDGESKKRFMHHYNFPPYSVGETGWFRGPGRREIGHGALAEKALEPLIPPKEEFPYTIRVVSEILTSNGSSSMASVCGSSLALMDAGVPMKKHVAGIAMGLMTGDGEAKILTDIQGPEDHYGDMDFKVAGTRDGVTAIQMDVKIEGATLEMLKKGLEQAKKARLQILDVLEGAIPEHRKEVSSYAPIIEMLKINPEKIGLLIGAGGRTIREIMEETSTDINVEDDGSVFVSGTRKEDVEKAVDLAFNLTREIKIGEEFDARVIKIADFGAFVELVPGQEALVHVSELSDDFVKDVGSVVKTGERLHVKVIKIDDNGKIGASVKQASKKESKGKDTE
ncbi:MAG: polyribonucleotide nucleotidyltransferase [Candidatus Spechtbacterales bacterium]|nr:polyribonucleotide nucleotidyltransferase [Candidatus Spechtbacterales bacterium]